jgi:signal transduction histidine kinase
LVKRSLAALAGLLEGASGEVRGKAGRSDLPHTFPLAALVADAQSMGSLNAAARGCEFLVPDVDPGVSLTGNRDHLLAALVNLLQNAFKFTHPNTQVTLHAYAVGDRVIIDVHDHCGGLPEGFADKMFKPFTQGGVDRRGLGLGLSIARKSVEADGGKLTVRDVPGEGCVFTIDLPRHMVQ